MSLFVNRNREVREMNHGRSRIVSVEKYLQASENKIKNYF